jgi:hypothetical protein
MTPWASICEWVGGRWERRRRDRQWWRARSVRGGKGRVEGSMGSVRRLEARGRPCLGIERSKGRSRSRLSRSRFFPKVVTRL